MLFDSHCHFTDEGFDDIRPELAEQIRSSKLARIVDIGTDLKTSLKAVLASETYDFCRAAVGYHPAEVGSLTEEELAKCLSLCARSRVVAIGEIGLDYHWEDNPPRDVQQHWFRRQLQEAARLGMPVCIHSRDADQDTLDILKEEAFPRKVPVLMHCFSGSAELARQYVKLGAKISFAGPITYKNARRNVEAAAAVDLKDLLIETDSPYLAPVPMRGKQNLPLYVRYVAEKIAEIKGVSLAEAEDATYRNACDFYRLPY